MILAKVNTVVSFDTKGRQIGNKGGTVKGMAHHNKTKNNRLWGGSGCKLHKDCFSCPFPDCVSNR